MGSSEDPSLVNNVDELGLVYLGLKPQAERKLITLRVYSLIVKLRKATLSFVCGKNNGYFTRRPMYIDDNISLSPS